jgi:hypothetical protein
MKRTTSAVIWGLVLSSCVWTSPETPGNAAIDIVGAIQTGDEKTLSQNICSKWTQELDLSDRSTLGPLEPMIETLAVRSAYGGASEYPGANSLDIAADHAWTEIDLLTEDPLDRIVWRFHMGARKRPLEGMRRGVPSRCTDSASGRWQHRGVRRSAIHHIWCTRAGGAQTVFGLALHMGSSVGCLRVR